MNNLISNKTLPYTKRKEMLMKLKRLILKNQADINQALKLDLNKSAQESYLTEIGPILMELNFTIKNLKKWMKPKKVRSNLVVFKSKSKIYPEPMGKVLIISPWNYPFQLLFVPLIGAISAGNQVVLKPSEVAKNSEKLISKLIKENFDPDEIKLVTGGPIVTTKLLNERFDLIFFTGSSRVGKIIMEKAAKNLTPVILELGGKSPVIVNDYKNLDQIAERIAWGKLLNAGQTCIAPDYLLIKKNLENEFIQAFHKAVVKFYGDNLLKNPDYPKIINKKHLLHLKEMLKTADPLLEVQTDDQKLGPVLVKVDPDHELMQEEIFGPILPIVTYQKIDQAINFIAKKEKPLALYLFTENKKLQKYVINSLSFGGATINDTIKHFISPYLPFGGVGNSGMGQYHGKATFDAFTHQKGVLSSSTKISIKVPFFPSRNKKMRILKKLLK